MRKSWRITASVLFLTTLLVGAFAGDRLLAVTDEDREKLRLYTELVSVAHEEYGADVTYKDLVFASVQGMLRTLDPHTSFLSPRAYTGMREKQRETFYGLGILVSKVDGALTVRTPIEGTPAAQLGIRAGDVISGIEGEPTDPMTLDEAVDKLKGPKGTTVNIEILRRGLKEPLKLAVTRAEIPQTTVRLAHMLDETTGYIRLTDFNRGSSREVAEAIAGLREQGMERLLFDLRNNGGGLLDQAIEVSDQFVPSGSDIVETRGRTRDSFQAFQSAGRFDPLGLPVVVLVNRGTASAAEIVSGAIQDHDVGLIIGSPTWGKGLVQTVYNLSYGAGLALTTARYYTPSGRLIQRDYTSYYDYVTVANADEPAAVDPNAEVFHTDLGREVYGGGGITPDVLIEADELSVFDQLLLSRNAYQNFAVDFTNRPDDKRKVSGPDWRPSADLVDRFKSWLIREEVMDAQEAEEGLAEEDNAQYALLTITGEILNNMYGQEAQHRALSEGDPQIQTAISMFQDASQLLAQRADLEERPSVAQPSSEGSSE